VSLNRDNLYCSTMTVSLKMMRKCEMKTMNMPRFTADASLYNTSGHYNTRRMLSQTDGSISLALVFVPPPPPEIFIPLPTTPRRPILERPLEQGPLPRPLGPLDPVTCCGSCLIDGVTRCNSRGLSLQQYDKCLDRACETCNATCFPSGSDACCYVEISTG
jgi:hypothetical protein